MKRNTANEKRAVIHTKFANKCEIQQKITNSNYTQTIRNIKNTNNNTKHEAIQTHAQHTHIHTHRQTYLIDTCVHAEN